MKFHIVYAYPILPHISSVRNIKCKVVQMYNRKRKIELLITISSYHSAVVICNALNYFDIKISFCNNFSVFQNSVLKKST